MYFELNAAASAIANATAPASTYCYFRAAKYALRPVRPLASSPTPPFIHTFPTTDNSCSIAAINVINQS